MYVPIEILVCKQDGVEDFLFLSTFTKRGDVSYYKNLKESKSLLGLCVCVKSRGSKIVAKYYKYNCFFTLVTESNEEKQFSNLIYIIGTYLHHHCNIASSSSKLIAKGVNFRL